MHLLWNFEYKFFKKKKIDGLDSLHVSDGIFPVLNESINSAVHLG